MGVMRLDWKYALRQELGWSGYHYSDRCNFRKRLLANQAEQRVFEDILKHLQAQGYIQAGGKVRSDSTSILRQADFQLDFASHQATCPAGQRSVSWRTYPRVR